jgi:hypothetical protein
VPPGDGTGERRADSHSSHWGLPFRGLNKQGYKCRRKYLCSPACACVCACMYQCSCLLVRMVCLSWALYDYVHVNAPSSEVGWELW